MSLEEILLMFSSIICLGIPVLSQLILKDNKAKTIFSRILSIVSALLLILIGIYLDKGEIILGEVVNVSLYLKWIYIASGAVLTLTLFSLEVLRGRSELWTSAYTLSILPLISLLFILYFKSLVVAMVAWILASTAGYILVGIKRDVLGAEGAIKYSLMGTLATVIFIYSLAMLSVNTDLLNPAALANGGEVTFLALMMLLASISIEAGAAPFHYWLPDAYTGSQPVITSILSTIVKVTSIGLLLNQFYTLTIISPESAMIGFSILAAVSMTWGNIAALTQPNVQRMMAYSSIAHIGYIYIGLASYNKEGVAGVLIYLIAYMLAKASTFLILDYLLRNVESLRLEDMKGAAYSYPISITALTISFLSLAGFPPLLGFWGKLYMFFSVIDWAPWLTILGIVNSGISVAYYFNVIVTSFRKPLKVNKSKILRELKDPCILIALIFSLASVIIGLLIPSLITEITSVSFEYLRDLRS